MKTVTANALAELTKELGTDPLIIIGIEWTEGSTTFYADKELTGVKSKILSIGNIEALAKANTTSQSVEITLDDTDAEIKNIIDTHNIHKVNCYVYQYYGALSDLADKFLLFQGQISTPFAWKEKERSITFTIVSEIESYEVGFSPEEGQLPFVRDEYIGKPWPLCFGHVVYVPAQKVSQTLEGQLLDTVCVVDELLYWKKERLRSQYWEQAFLMKFFVLVANGAELYAPQVQLILVQYIRQIILERQNFATLRAILDKIDELNKKIKKGGPDVGALKSELKNYERALDEETTKSHSIQVEKERIEKVAFLADFKYQLQKDAFLKISSAYNQMQQIYNEYVLVQAEICNQSECAVSEVRIQNGQNFPQNVAMDVYIKDTKFRGTMVDDRFTFVSLPTAKYENLEVDTWVEDDDPCAPNDATNGINLFWLKDDPPVNLTGMWLLVKKRGDTGNFRHFIKVERQVGRKVYFTPTAWAGAGEGQPEGLSIDNIINELVNTPFMTLPMRNRIGQVTGSVGVPVEMFTGDWATSAWNMPESQTLLDIINSIPGGVNAHELQILARLVFLAPTDNMNGLVFTEPGPRDIYTIIGEDVEIVQEASSMIHRHWIQTFSVTFEEVPESMFWQAEVGSSVRTDVRDRAIYIANILPSTIKAVHAYRTLENGTRILSPVPSSYYVKNESANLGTIDVTALSFPFSLRNIPGEGWEDDIYVTLNSSVGPHVPDIIQHLVETYSSISVNAANFAAVKTKLTNYPANFALIDDRPNVLNEIERIAFESRCAIYRVGNELFLKYLAEEPAADVTYTESNISDDSHFDIAFPQTEDLITRLIAIWRPHYLPLEATRKQIRLVLRHNVKRYGLHSQEIDFHIYNDRSLVLKSATFWLIRKANTWKHLLFRTFLTEIRLDSYDTIQFNFAEPYIAEGNVKGVLQSITYDPSSNMLEFDVELPIRAGEMTKYPFYWSASAGATEAFPTVVEIEEGYAGGFGPGGGVTGTIEDV
jgi:hypothetical protein